MFVFFLQSSVAQEKKVLFLGNSYTAVNDLPSLLVALALSGGHNLYTDRNTPGGYTLAYPSNGHLYNQTSLSKIAAEDWDYVVLQEQSQFPVVDHFRNNYTYPGSINLDSIIRNSHPCSQTMFYMTWGRKYGGQQCIDNYCSVDFVDYAHMQDSLASAYLNMSNFLDTPVSPVGIAWKKSIVEYGDPIELFSGDGSHPSMAGSYLAACTFYAAIYQESPIGLSYLGGLSEGDANYLQTIADETVLGNLELWNIDTTTVRAEFDYNQNGAEVIFENLSVNSDEYHWDFGNGDTDTTFSPTYTYLESGEFEVTLKAFSGCNVDSAISTINIVISATNILNMDERVSVYPIPASDKLMLNYDFANNFSDYTYTISDLSGKTILQGDFEKNSFELEIDIQNLNSGIYFLANYADTKIIGLSKFVKH